MLQFAPMNTREFLIAPIAYLAAEKAIDGLSAADAERHVTGVAHSVAEIIAHVSFWQDWFKHVYGECAADGIVAASGWPRSRRAPASRAVPFVGCLHQLARGGWRCVPGRGSAHRVSAVAAYTVATR